MPRNLGGASRPAPPRIRRPHTGRPEGLCAVVPGSVSYTPGTTRPGPRRTSPWTAPGTTGPSRPFGGVHSGCAPRPGPRIVDHLVYDAPVAALVAVTEGSAQEGVVALGEVVLGSARCRGGGVVVSRLRLLARVLVVADGDAQVPLGAHGRAAQDPVVRLGEPGVSTAVKTLSDYCREDALRRSAETAAAARLGARSEGSFWSPQRTWQQAGGGPRLVVVDCSPQLNAPASAGRTRRPGRAAWVSRFSPLTRGRSGPQRGPSARFSRVVTGSGWGSAGRRPAGGRVERR